MEIRVLGCSGVQLPGFGTTSFMLNSKILIDAGTITSVLTLEEQIGIDYILVTHAHLDHIRDIMFLADNINSIKEYPVVVITTAGIIDIMKEHLFNDIIWPDFSVLPSPQKPAISFQAILPGTKFSLNDMEITAVRVDHVVETLAYVVEFGDGSVVFIGDTGPTDEIWRVANGLDDLQAVFVEVSFPDNMKSIADAAGHLTPSGLKSELEKLTSGSLPIYLYHLKPKYRETIEREVGSIGRGDIHFLNDGDVIHV
jgi:ribonuclease BN (tRNA processing enzyme)